jgi:hypothetical protein
MVASGYSALGLAPGDKVGVCGPNCPEWMISMQVGRCLPSFRGCALVMG